MDGIFVRGIELTAEPSAPVFHLPLDDNGPDATVRDLAPGGVHQVLLDPSGDPSTAAHSVPGPHGTTALAFDGVDDRIDFGPELLADLVGAERDFTLALWYRTATGPGPAVKTFFRREASTAEPYLKLAAGFDRFYWRIGWGEGQELLLSGFGMGNDAWHHVACRRAGGTLTLWVDGAVHETKTDPNCTRSFGGDAWDPRAIGQVYGAAESNWPFSLADLRAYSRALRDDEMVALANP
jgi:sialidase-1